MKSVFDKLNLRPQERRLVVGVAIVVFAVVNFWLVIPHFGDLGRTRQRKIDAEKTLKKFQDELGKKDRYQRELNNLEKMGQFLPSEEQALELQREVDLQARQAGVNVVRWDGSRGAGQRTNSFFEEQTLVIVVNTGEKELVDFLWGLGKGQSLTRVSSMSLQRDPSQTKLSGNLTLVKSFQKKPPRAATPAPVAAANPVRAASKAAPPAAKGTTNPPPATNTNLAKRSAPAQPPKK